jgi:hypothetical protein
MVSLNRENAAIRNLREKRAHGSGRACARA